MQIGHGPPFVRESLFGGHGRVLVWDLLRGRAAPPFTAVLSCVLEEKGYVGRHVQQEYDEIVVGLTGYGEARVNGKPQPFGPGAVVYLPLGSALELVNEAPDKELRYLIIKAQRDHSEDEVVVEAEPEVEQELRPPGEPELRSPGPSADDDHDVDADVDEADDDGDAGPHELEEPDDEPGADPGHEADEPERPGGAAVAGVIEDD